MGDNSVVVPVKYDTAARTGDFQKAGLRVRLDAGDVQGQPLAVGKTNNRESLVFVGVFLPSSLGCPEAVGGKTAYRYIPQYIFLPRKQHLSLRKASHA